MAHHKVGESVKDVEGKSCDEVEEEPGAEVVHLVGQGAQIRSTNQTHPFKIIFGGNFQKHKRNNRPDTPTHP